MIEKCNIDYKKNPEPIFRISILGTSVLFMRTLQPGLSGNPFFSGWQKPRQKKDWERKTEMSAQIIILDVHQNNRSLSA